MEDLFLVAYTQNQGAKRNQEDRIGVFDTQCIAIADGVSALSHGTIASTFVCDTALWGYKHVRQRPYYWEDKIKLLQRIFRTTNLALWQKRKEPGYEDGLASTLSLAILGVNKIWVGSVGNSRIYLIREGLVEELVSPEQQSTQSVTMALGFVRSGITPRFQSESLISGDVVILCTDGVSDFVTEEDIRLAYELTGETNESCMKSAIFLLQQAEERGSNENMSVCVVKKI